VEDEVYIADMGNDRVILVRFPAETPESVWSEMKSKILAGNIEAALNCFSRLSVEEYRRTFQSIGPQELRPLLSEIPRLAPVAIERDTAQYRFDGTVQGFKITFPVHFVKENGKWKIESF
jgi:hypothetical protein